MDKPGSYDDPPPYSKGAFVDNGASTSNVPTVITVKGGLTTKKLVIIVASIAVVGTLTGVGLTVGILNLKKGDSAPPTKQPPSPEDINGPINGQWTYWDQWSDCTVTCGGGTQLRRRTCSSPEPMFGGKDCVGISSETRRCSVWNCPDCSKKCQDNGNLTENCDVCLCKDNILFGRVTTPDGHPVDGMGVFLSDRLWESIATTNIWGRYSVSGICSNAATLNLQKTGYATNVTATSKINSTHWQADGIARKLEAPFITTNPQNKVRFVGQSASLCCKADGFPVPTSYKWYKDGDIIMGRGENGNLNFTGLKTTDTGSYICKTETLAGIVSSQQSILSVVDSATDSCSKTPVEKIQNLPFGCHATQDGITLDYINVGECPHVQCIKDGLLDDRSCNDAWESHCCSSNEKQTVDVHCDTGFSYPITKIISCHCTRYTVKTTLSGRASGKKGDQIFPFSRGTIRRDGRIVGYTSSSGFFSIDFPSDVTKATLSFEGDRSGQLMDTLKVVSVVQGKSSRIDITVPVKPDILPFNTMVGFDIPVGGNNGMRSIGSVAIPENSVVDSDGNAVEGVANARLHFVDPRSVEDLGMMYGELESTDENGEAVGLETYGMMSLSLEDSSNNPLYLKGQIKFVIDPDVFNISISEGEESDISMWLLDENTGKWVDQGKIKQTQNDGNRKKRSSPNFEGVGNIDSIQEIRHEYQITTSLTQTRYRRTQAWRANVDKPIRYELQVFYSTQYRREVRIQDDACYARVRTFTDFSFSQAASVSISGITRERNGQRFRGFETLTTNTDGFACIRIFCGSEIFIRSENSRFYPDERHYNVPTTLPFQNVANATQCYFNSPDTIGGVPAQNTPVFHHSRRHLCTNFPAAGSYFRFAQLSIQPELDAQNDQTFDEANSWYTHPETNPLRRNCFLKVLVEADFHDLRLISTSVTVFGGRQVIFGTYQVTPFWDETTNSRRDKGACLEFRCPGIINEGGVITSDVPVTVWAQLTSGSLMSCIVTNGGVNVTEAENGFVFEADPKTNYGPKFGVFSRALPREDVLNMCHTGIDTGAISDVMKPTVNPAVILRCRKTP